MRNQPEIAGFKNLLILELPNRNWVGKTPTLPKWAKIARAAGGVGVPFTA